MSTKPIRSFTDLVGVLSRGRFSEKCDQHLTDAMQALDALPDGKGKVTLTVTLDIAFQEGRVDVKPSVKSKLPEEKSFGATPFWSMEGGFSVQHPQPERHVRRPPQRGPGSRARFRLILPP